MLKNTDIYKTSAPKYCVIKDAIKQNILDGKYDEAQGRLPSCRDLVKICGVSYMTINKALNLLQDEGYAKMIRGKGIFASRPKHIKTAEKANKAGFLMQIAGDVYKNMFSVILNGLEAEDILSVPLYSTSAFDNMLQWEKDAKFDKFTSQGFKSLVIDGTRHFPFTLLKKYYNRLNQIIFVSHFESDIDFPDANFILGDFRKGGYLAADCLLKNGRKKIAFITFEKLSKVEHVQNGCAEKYYDRDVIEGTKKAFEENGIDFENNFSVIYDNPKIHDDSSISHPLTDFFASGGDGIICLGDHRALHVYKHAIKNKIKIGKDVGVVGYYNTSWTEVYNPPLTSVSIQEEEMGKLSIEAILNKWKGKKVIVKPKLIRRGSE